MLAETGSLTTVLDQFLNVFRLGQRDVAVQAWSLLTTMATIEILLASLWWAFTGQDAIVGLIRRLLSIGFFVFVVQNYDTLLHAVIDGFIQTGKTAAFSASDANFVRDPSTIIDVAFVDAEPIFEHLKSYSGLDVLSNLHDIIITGLCGILILVSYFIIAIQVFVTYLEFAIVSTLGLILVPFGVFRHTAFLAEKVFGSIISFGVKLMVLGLLVSVTVPVLSQYTVPADPGWKPLFNLVLICLAVAALAWHAPGVAAGLLAGGPSLTANTAASTALAGASGAAAAPYIAHTAASSTIQSTVVAAKGAATLGGGAAGLVTAGGSAAASGLRNAGYGGSVQAAGAVAGAAYAVGSDAVKTAFRPFRQLGGIASQAFTNKQLSIPSFVRLKAREALGDQAASSSAKSSDTENASTQGPKPEPKEQTRDDYSKLKKAFHLTKQAVPRTAQPSGGVHVPLSKKEENHE